MQAKHFAQKIINLKKIFKPALKCHQSKGLQEGSSKRTTTRTSDVLTLGPFVYKIKKNKVFMNIPEAILGSSCLNPRTWEAETRKGSP